MNNLEDCKTYLHLMNKLEPSQLNPKLGRGLKMLRELNGSTLEFTARKYQCSRNTVFNIENGTYKRYIRADKLFKMLKALEWDSSLIEFLDLCDLKKFLQ